jgi:hypothetical protein
MRVLKKIPLELFDEIKSYLSKKDYWRFLVSMNEQFVELRFCTRTITLNGNQVELFLKNSNYVNLVLSKLKVPSKQLFINLTTSQNERFYVQERQLLTALSLSCNEFCLDGTKLGSEAMQMLETLTAVTFGSMAMKNFLLHDLKPFKHLVQLKLIYCANVEDLTCFKSLQRLTVQNCAGVKEVSSLGNIPELEFDSCPGLRDVSALTNNRSLSLIQCYGITKLPSAFHGIRYQGSMREEEISFPNLKYLKLIGHSFKDDVLSKYSFLFAQLWTLELNTCPYFTALRGTQCLLRIKIHNCAMVDDISDLGERNQVVSISSCPKIRDFSPLRKVRMVRLEHCDGFTDGHDVQSVFHLTIRDCPRFVDPFMLGKVRHLEIYTFVKSFEGLGNVPVLEFDFYPRGKNVSHYFKSLGGGRNCQIIFPHGYFPHYQSGFSSLEKYRIVSGQYEDYRSKCILVRK